MASGVRNAVSTMTRAATESCRCTQRNMSRTGIAKLIPGTVWMNNSPVSMTPFPGISSRASGYAASEAMMIVKKASDRAT